MWDQTGATHLIPTMQYTTFFNFCQDSMSSSESGTPIGELPLVELIEEDEAEKTLDLAPPSLLESPESTEIFLGDTLKNIRFEPKTDASGKVVRFVSSAPGRKAIVYLGIDLEAGRSYTVVVIKDSKPTDSTKGQYLVSIVHDAGEGDVPLKKIEKKEAQGTPAIEIDRERGVVYILDIELPLCDKPSALVPHEKKFQFFTWDVQTVEILYKVAQAVKLKQPCLLEGPTAASKTSAIEYLAMLTGHGVLRINLSGQTDTSELIGKFVPNDGQLSMRFEELLASKERLTPASRELLDTAHAERRSLTQVESKILAENEGFSVPEWRWKDGVVPRGMKEGLWVILDEWNLAEQDVRERLNPALERPPSLTLTENSDATIGPNGQYQVDSDHNLFATMNPAGGEYEKRKPMSPAEADRWGSYTQVGRPDATSYQQMLIKAVYGRHPDIEIRGQKYTGAHEKSSFQTLESLKTETMEAFLVELSKFHHQLAEMADKREIGKDRKQKYIFTRRGLIEFLAFLEAASFVTDRTTRATKTVKTASKEIIQKALKYYYLDRIHADEHKKIQDVLDLYGLSESKWKFNFDV